MKRLLPLLILLTVLLIPLSVKAENQAVFACIDDFSSGDGTMAGYTVTDNITCAFEGGVYTVTASGVPFRSVTLLDGFVDCHESWGAYLFDELYGIALRITTYDKAVGIIPRLYFAGESGGARLFPASSESLELYDANGVSMAHDGTFTIESAGIYVPANFDGYLVFRLTGGDVLPETYSPLLSEVHSLAMYLCSGDDYSRNMDNIRFSLSGIYAAESVTPIPTPTPTLAPEPSVAPTTSAPIPTPTPAPSEAPTDEPTNEPTEVPADEPSKGATAANGWLLPVAIGAVVLLVVSTGMLLKNKK